MVSARCSRKVLSAIGLLIPAPSILRLLSKALFTRGSSHSLITLTWSSFLSLNNSNRGQIEPRRDRAVIFSWAISNAFVNEPQASSVAEPFGPIAVFPGIGREADKVSKFFPNRNSEAASRVNRLYKSWTSQAVSFASKHDKMLKVRALYLSKTSKSDIRSRAKNGRAIVRC